jgi:hypothetical protein
MHASTLGLNEEAIDEVWEFRVSNKGERNCSEF